jgi:protoporphyrinogen oxidase
VVILGGGLSGIATAHVLAQAGYRDITIVERESRLGGLAGSIEQNGFILKTHYHEVTTIGPYQIRMRN